MLFCKQYIRYIVILLLLLSICLLYGCGKDSQTKSKESRHTTKLSINSSDLYTLELSSDIQYIDITGESRANIRSIVTPEISSLLQSITAQEGSFVQKGQIVAVMQNLDIYDQYTQAQSQINSLKSDIALTKLSLDRKQNAYNQDLISKQDLDQAQTLYNTQKESLKQLQASLNIAQNNLNKRYIRSPITGIVSQELATIGTRVNTGEPVLEILDLNPLKIYFDIPSQYSSFIHIGTEIIIQIQGQEHKSVINKILPATDPDTRSISVITSVPNTNNKLLSNIYCQGQVLLQELTDIISIPREAINIDTSKQYYIYTFDAQDQTLNKQYITFEPLPSTSQQLYITSPIQTGKQILSIPLPNHNDSVPINIIEE